MNKAAKIPLNVNLLSLNGRGLNKESKRKSIFQYIRKKNIDIAFLQETYSTQDVENLWKNQWGGDTYYAHGTNHSKGVMILIKPGLDIKVLKCVADEKGWFLLLDVTLQGEKVILLNLYAPNHENDQIKFYDRLNHLLEDNKCENHKCIVGGDTNVIRDPSLDRKGGNFRDSRQYQSVIE